MYKFGSLFTGIGGFDLGFERAGMQCAWQVERDANCQKLLEKRYPNVKRYDDVRTVGNKNLEPVDVICGGFPCQDVSIAGKRSGLDGERSGLWTEFARIIDELEPRWVVIENVPGLLSSNRGRDFYSIVRWLVERGYSVCWRILDSQYFGVAQRRRRVFIVASFGSGRCAKVLFESESVQRNFDKSGKKGKETTWVSGTLSANGGGLDRPEGQGNELDFCVPTFTAKQVYGKQPDNSNSSTPGNFVTAFAWQQGATKKGRERIVRKGDYTGSVTAENVDAIFSPSIGVRRLTPTECERLQGFPDGWTEGQSDSQRYKQLGNSVAVPCAEWIARRLFAITTIQD